MILHEAAGRAVRMNTFKRLSLCFVAICGLVAGSVQPTAAESAPGRLGALSSVTRHGATTTLHAGAAAVRVSFPLPGAVRIRLAPKGRFTDPAGHTIIGGATHPVRPRVRPRVRDHGSYLTLSAGSVTLRADKAPLTFAMYRHGRKLWTERRPLAWTKDATTQTLRRGKHEQFYGAGEQNGSFSHRGQTVRVRNDTDWDEGGAPNSQPFYGSTAGYGVLRNTFKPGKYAFTDPVRTTQSERRFDAVYVAGKQPKDVVDGYTDLVGKPFLPPLYGLETGDSDCYLHNANRGERHTKDALKVADGYRKHRMPNGWMLVNDGYGCGYENLKHVGKALRKRNMQLGLWTEDGLPNQSKETAAGTRVRKLDVKWVGQGYRMALNACDKAKQGIEKGTDARGLVWQPVSWAGAQRCAVLWSGDQKGGWDYIRWQIPTYAGSAMSGIAYNTGDIDGIFGGSAKTYVRDLQWKMLLPVAMTMDGWADKDKQPWRYGEPYTSINRKYLNLHERLLPYMYSYSVAAHRTGVGQARPLAMEYPHDPKAWSNAARYEFLSGKDFLVAPVYSDTDKRDGIYLPKGNWTDYWSGKTYHGPTTVDGYHAPLSKLPLFVRDGAIVPMWPKGTKSWKTRDKSSMDVDVYPGKRHSRFTLAEDDGVTRSAARSRQRFAVDRLGPATRIHIGRTRGSYSGQPERRAYRLTVHTRHRPKAVLGARGWSYDRHSGTVHIRTAPLDKDRAGNVTLLG